MSHSCHSKVVIGVELGLESKIQEKSFQRFDPKTGKPIEHIGRVLDVVLTCGNVNIQLLEDEVTFEESNHRWEHGYFNDRLNSKIYDFMNNFGIDSDDYEGLFYHVNSLNNLHPLDQKNQKNSVILGIVVAEGSSNRPVVEIPNYLDLLKTYKQQFMDETLDVQDKFQHELFDIKLFLLT